MLNALPAIALLASLAASTPAAQKSAPPSGIVFIDDDYAGALAKAKAQHKPLFLDSWATWCHSCLSMKAFVFPDAGLRAAKDAVVWLAVETEMEKNRAVVEKFPVDGLPTFLVIDPDTEQVIGKWLGSSSVNEMRQFVLDTAAAWQTTRKGGKLSPAAEAEREGHTAQQAGDRQAAATAYRKAVSLTEKKDPPAPGRVALLVSALGGLGTPAAAKECVELARRGLATMPASPRCGLQHQRCGLRRGAKGEPSQALLTSAMARMEQLAGDTKAALWWTVGATLYAHLAEHWTRSSAPRAVAAMRKRSAMLEEPPRRRRTRSPRPPSTPPDRHLPLPGRGPQGGGDALRPREGSRPTTTRPPG
jgi:thioredoxin-like negative regulator of GroEL